MKRFRSLNFYLSNTSYILLQHAYSWCTPILSTYLAPLLHTSDNYNNKGDAAPVICGVYSTINRYVPPIFNFPACNVQSATILDLVMQQHVASVALLTLHHKQYRLYNHTNLNCDSQGGCFGLILAGGLSEVSVIIFRRTGYTRVNSTGFTDAAPSALVRRRRRIAL